MTPNIHHDHDRKWLKEQLSKLPNSVALEICGKYSAYYKKAYDDEPVAHRKESKARVEANTRLREFVKKYNEWESSKC